MVMPTRGGDGRSAWIEELLRGQDQSPHGTKYVVMGRIPVHGTIKHSEGTRVGGDETWVILVTGRAYYVAGLPEFRRNEQAVQDFS